MRNICKICNQRPVAINYHKNDKVYYRSKCDHCSRNRKNGIPLWKRAGYKKKLNCEKCGFTSKYSEQFAVYHVDGNLTNCSFVNLKTVCANCQLILYKFNLPWKRGDLIADF